MLKEIAYREVVVGRKPEEHTSWVIEHHMSIGLIISGKPGDIIVTAKTPRLPRHATTKNVLVVARRDGAFHLIEGRISVKQDGVVNGRIPFKFTPKDERYLNGSPVEVIGYVINTISGDGCR